MNLSDVFGGLADGVIRLLPRSPFRAWLDAAHSIPGLGVLNYFIPVAEMVSILQLWLVAIGLFYLYSVIARWVKLLGD